MNIFTIKDIENLSGIKAHTIRIWEQRFDIIKPKRKCTNHRYYDNQDLKKILRISYLYHAGAKISHIASMSDEEIRKQALETYDKPRFYDVHINQLLEAMLDFDEVCFEKIFNKLLLHIGFEKTITQVIYPYLEKIGILWATDHLLPAQEHFSSNLIRKKMMVAIDGLRSNPKAEVHYLLFLPEGEYHEIPLLFIQYLLKKSGKYTTNFGTNVPLDNARHFANTLRVTHIMTHVITNFTNMEMEDYVEKVAELFPDKTIIISGPQNNNISKPMPENVTLLKSLQQIIDYTTANHA